MQINTAPSTQVLDLLKQANLIIDKNKAPAVSPQLPKVDRDVVAHIYALAGFLHKTGAGAIAFQAKDVIVEVRRIA